MKHLSIYRLGGGSEPPPFSVVKIVNPCTNPQSISKWHHFETWVNKSFFFLINSWHFLLYCTTISYLVSFIPLVFLVFPFALLFIWQELCRHMQLVTVLIIKSLPIPTQVHWALPRLVDTCLPLEDILRQDEHGHFHANNKTSHLYFFIILSLHTLLHLVTS